jgi:hypothetical protein
MKIEIKQLKCDHCGKIAENRVDFGGSPVNGWFQVSKIYRGYSSFQILQNDGPWDFCCEECLIQHINSLKAMKTPSKFTKEVEEDADEIFPGITDFVENSRKEKKG